MHQEQRFRIFGVWGILIYSLAFGAADPQWIEVRSPNFVVVSDASAKQARRAADRFEQFRNVIHAIMPKLRLDQGAPLTVFAARDVESFKALLPAEFKKKGMMQPSGLFQAGPDRSFVILRLDLPPEQGYHIIYHEYVHDLMRINFRTLPVWLSEGFADFFGQATISDTESGIGKPSPEQIRTLQEGQLIPLQALMSADHDSPLYREEGKSRLFYAQCWGLTHYLMLGDNRSHGKQLISYLDLILAGVPSAEAASRAFGDLKSLQRQLDQYVRSMGFYYYRVATRVKAQDEQYAVRNLSAAEYRAGRGEMMVHTGQLEEARLALTLALQEDPRSAAANEAMGWLSLRQNDRTQAAKYFVAASDLESTRFMTHYYAAQLTYEKGEADRREVVELCLRRAVRINPQFAPGVHMLSLLLGMHEGNRPEALELARQAAALAPENMSYQIDVGRILMTMGRIEEAADHAKRLAASAGSESDRQLADSFLDTVSSRQKILLEARQRSEQALAKANRPVETPRTNDALPTARPVETPEVKTGPAVKISGVIRTVACEPPALMNLVLDVNGKQVSLRARNHFQVQYWAVGSAGKDNFQPCDELQGKTVQIEYLTVQGQEYAGLITSVWIEKR